MNKKLIFFKFSLSIFYHVAGGRERQLVLAPAAPAWDSSSPINVIIYILCFRFFRCIFCIKIRIYRLKNTTKKNEKLILITDTCWPQEDRVENRGAEDREAQLKRQTGSTGGSCYITKIRVLIYNCCYTTVVVDISC